MEARKATLIGDVEVTAGAMAPEGRACELSVRGACGQHVASLTPDEVRALIDALTPYARRRPPWRGGKRKP